MEQTIKNERDLLPDRPTAYVTERITNLGELENLLRKTLAYINYGIEHVTKGDCERALDVLTVAQTMAEKAQKFDFKYVYYEESHEDVFILNAKADAIQFVMADAGAAGAITVASAAGTETAGDTVITVNGTKESGTTLAYKIAASAIAAPGLGEVPSGYTAFASGATLAGQTASQYIRVVELNADGKVIATGTAQLTVKAA